MEQDLATEWDEKRRIVILRTPKGDCLLTLENFEKFCRHGLGLVDGIRQQDKIREELQNFFSQLQSKRNNEPISAEESNKVVTEGVEKFLKEQRKS